MGQVKKVEVEDAIQRAAFELFARRGYANTSLAQIAARAGISPANVYVYFASKLEILYAIYDPWMRARLERLEGELLRIDGAYTRVRHLLKTIWRDIPAEENGFVNNIMQAIAAYEPGEGYRPTLLRWMESRIDRMIREALPPARRRALGRADLAHLVVMAFDGYILYRRLDPARPCDDATLDLVARLIAGPPARGRAARAHEPEGPRARRNVR
jgi:AcrR family transcriptional regulator